MTPSHQLSQRPYQEVAPRLNRRYRQDSETVEDTPKTERACGVYWAQARRANAVWLSGRQLASTIGVSGSDFFTRSYRGSSSRDYMEISCAWLTRS